MSSNQDIEELARKYGKEREFGERTEIPPPGDFLADLFTELLDMPTAKYTVISNELRDGHYTTEDLQSFVNDIEYYFSFAVNDMTTAWARISNFMTDATKHLASRMEEPVVLDMSNIERRIYFVWDHIQDHDIILKGYVAVSRSKEGDRIFGVECFSKPNILTLCEATIKDREIKFKEIQDE